ncbi:unnamed protein product [Paramecium primaurelia]|uniref:Uncharacterized protein n=1 Tax=Paramecium primaurelia TaxID=5886 RepID=A0A8S1QLQ3_PARPR|nr:unnamed protein product [Paramecium primaurelia]
MNQIQLQEILQKLILSIPQIINTYPLLEPQSIDEQNQPQNLEENKENQNFHYDQLVQNITDPLLELEPQEKELRIIEQNKKSDNQSAQQQLEQTQNRVYIDLEQNQQSGDNNDELNRQKQGKKFEQEQKQQQQSKQNQNPVQIDLKNNQYSGENNDILNMKNQGKNFDNQQQQQQLEKTQNNIQVGLEKSLQQAEIENKQQQNKTLEQKKQQEQKSKEKDSSQNQISDVQEISIQELSSQHEEQQSLQKNKKNSIDNSLVSQEDSFQQKQDYSQNKRLKKLSSVDNFSQIDELLEQKQRIEQLCKWQQKVEKVLQILLSKFNNGDQIQITKTTKKRINQNSSLNDDEDNEDFDNNELVNKQSKKSKKLKYLLNALTPEEKKKFEYHVEKSKQIKVSVFGHQEEEYIRCKLCNCSKSLEIEASK